MTRLEDLAAGSSVRGLTPEGLATVQSVQWYGDQAVEVIYRDSAGTLASRIVYRNEEPNREITRLAGQSAPGGGQTEMFS